MGENIQTCIFRSVEERNVKGVFFCLVFGSIEERDKGVYLSYCQSLYIIFLLTSVGSSLYSRFTYGSVFVNKKLNFVSIVIFNCGSDCCINL